MAYNTEILKKQIVDSLISQGFTVNGQIIPQELSKEAIKPLHDFSRNEQIEMHRKFIIKNYPIIERYLINGSDINPRNISLELKVIEPNTIEETIFKWWNFIWWSIPYQRAYGRQMRFLLWDKTHNAPFGLIGLQSPILKMSIRDKYLKIPKEELDIWINKSMQAQRLGALPPYNMILGGKMVAMSLISSQLKAEYERKYTNKKTVIEGRVINPDLLFITTTSAFGRSSIYNRLKIENREVAQSIGYTKGSGTFHIPQKIYIEVLKYLEEEGINTSTTFGNGPSRKIKLLDIAFNKLGLGDYTYHNIKREFFMFPLVSNLNEVIHNNNIPKYDTWNLTELEEFWKKRWCIPRSNKYEDWNKFNSEKYIHEVISKVNHGKTQKNYHVKF